MALSTVVFFTSTENIVCLYLCDIYSCPGTIYVANCMIYEAILITDINISQIRKLIIFLSLFVINLFVLYKTMIY